MADENESAIKEDELDLTLGLRPPKNILETCSIKEDDDDLFRKREQQAIRRYEAKIKRDLKRKNSGDADFQGGCRKGFHIRVQSTLMTGNCNNGGGFRPHNNNININNNYDAENRCSGSSGSSSAISDNYYSNNNNNNSAQGGHSSDTSSHSSHPHMYLPASNIPTPTSSLKQPSSSQQDQDTPNCSNQIQLLTNSISFSKSPEVVTPTNTNIIPQQRETTSKEVKVVLGNPPKPNGEMKRQESGSMPQMPCVTTTGNGPKGKTITGFLYKYTKTEVSIVCVCHGTSFTPADFVEHAGGVDIEHPLKHIRVAPFPLG